MHLSDGSHAGGSLGYGVTEIAAHNAFWYWYQFIWLVPANVLTLWLFIKRMDYHKIIWHPDFLIDPNYIGPKKNDDAPRQLRREYTPTWEDKVAKVYVLFAIPYYFFDSIYIIQYYDITTEICMLGMFLHHLATMYSFKNIWDMPHYSWFVMYPLAFHCFLIVFPYTLWLQYIYAIGLACFVWGLATVEPFTQGRPY